MQPASQLASDSRYTLVRKLGSGGMGAVYEAEDSRTGARVALKTVINTAPEEIERLRHEFRALREIQHHNLVDFGDLIYDGGRWYFTMELIDGVPLLDWIEEDPRRLRDAIVQLTCALVELHRHGKVHRDVKPQNVLVESTGRLVLVDFGLAANIDEALSMDNGWVLGTAAYMAPEQADGKGVGPAADLYSVGVIMYEALCGQRPFEGAALEIMLNKQHSTPLAPGNIADGVPPDLEALCLDLLRIDASERPTAAQILQRLGLDDTGWPLASEPVTSSEPKELFVGRRSELAMIRRAYRDSHKKTVAMVVHGHSGVGKSALVNRFLRELPPYAWVLEGRCYDRESFPFKGFDGIFASLGRLLKRLPDAEVEALLPPKVWLLSEAFPALRRVEQIGNARYSQPVAEEDRRFEMFRAARALLRRVCEQRPVVMAIEDVQWMDNDGLALFGELLREPGSAKLLAIAAVRTRPGSQEITDRLAMLDAHKGTSTRQLALGHLRTGDAQDLAETLLYRTGFHGDAEQIAETSGGHPLFLDALVRDAKNGRRSDLDQLLCARADSLGGDERRLLDLLAVSGGPTPNAVLISAVGIEPAAFNRTVRSLRLARLLRRACTPKEHLDVYHDRLRTALLSRLSDDERRQHHRTLANAFEERGESDPQLLLGHLRGAGELGRAARQAVTAAESALAAFGFEHAATLYRSAIELAFEALRRRPATNDDELADALYHPASDPNASPFTASEVVSLWSQLALMLGFCGRGRAAARACELAARGAPGRSEKIDLARRAGAYLLAAGHSEGQEVYEQALRAFGVRLPKKRSLRLARAAWSRLFPVKQPPGGALVDDAQLPEMARTELGLLSSAVTALGLVDPVTALCLLPQYARLARQHRSRTHTVLALAIDATYRAATGRSPERSELDLNRARATARRGEVAIVEATAGVCAGLSGQWSLAAEHIERSISLTGAGHREFLQNKVLHALLAGVHAFRGNIPWLREVVPAHYRAARERNDVSLAAILGASNVLALLADGDHTTAFSQVAEIEAAWGEDGPSVPLFPLRAAQMRIETYLRTPRTPLRELVDRQKTFERSALRGMPYARINVLDASGRGALLQNGTEAKELTRSCAAELLKISFPWAQGVGHVLTAGQNWRYGSKESAVVSARLAHDSFDQCGMLVHAASIRLRLGEMLQGSEGAQEYESARQALLSLGVRDPDEFSWVAVPFAVTD